MKRGFSGGIERVPTNAVSRRQAATPCARHRSEMLRPAPQGVPHYSRIGLVGWARYGEEFR